MLMPVLIELTFIIFTFLENATVYEISTVIYFLNLLKFTVNMFQYNTVLILYLKETQGNCEVI